MTNKQGSIKGNIMADKTRVQVSLPLIVFEEDGSNIVYCPALDVSGYGMSESEAMASFTHCLSEFFVYTMHKNTLHEEMVRMGWKIRKSKCTKMTPPPMSKLLETNDNFSRIFNDHPYRKIDQSIDIPIAY